MHNRSAWGLGAYLGRTVLYEQGEVEIGVVKMALFLVWETWWNRPINSKKGAKVNWELAQPMSWLWPFEREVTCDLRSCLFRVSMFSIAPTKEGREDRTYISLPSSLPCTKLYYYISFRNFSFSFIHSWLARSTSTFYYSFISFSSLDSRQAGSFLVGSKPQCHSWYFDI